MGRACYWFYICRDTPANRFRKIEVKDCSVRKFTPDNAGFGIFLAFALLPLSGLGTDIYLPSLPTMSRHFGVPAAQVQLSITLFLIGYGVGQLFAGSVMDSFGRYWTGLVALFLFGLTSLLIAFTSDMDVINGARLLQGLFGACVVVAKRSFFVDLFTGKRLKHYLSLFTVAWSLGPIIGPFVGGYLQAWFGWQANFIFLAAFSWIFVGLELWRGGESLQHFQRFHVGDIVRRYAEMLTHRAFMGNLLVVSLCYSTTMLFSLSAPFIVEHTLQRSPITTGYSALLMGFAWMTGGLTARTQLHRPLLQKHGAAAACLLVMALAMALTFPWVGNLLSLLAFAFCIHAAAGLAFNIYFAECLSMFPKNAALSGGLTGGLVFLLTSVLSYGVVSLTTLGNQAQLACGYLGFAVLIAGMWAVTRNGQAAGVQH